MTTSPKRFRPGGGRQPQQAKREYDDRRGTAASRGYGYAWAKAAKGHLRNHPLCVGCEAAGRVTAAELVDHVEPHKGDQAKFWDTSKWQSSCRWHHDVVKQRLELMWAAGRIGASDLRLDSAAAVRLTEQLGGP